MDAASKEEPQTRKRRSRTSNSPDNSGDDGKKRGRPRVEKQDESAADRRRTQIRMAQRAYRQRKESTLEELRKRVSELTNMIELMNKAFIDCRDKLASSGMPANQIQDMRETSMQFEALLKCARNPGEECDPEITQIIQQSSGSNDGDQNKTMQPKNVPSWMDEAAVQAVSRPRGSTAQVGMGYEMYNDQGTDEMDIDYLGDFGQSQAIGPAKPSSLSSFDAFRMDMPTSMNIPASLTSPMTYSFQETTFGRRLHRACLEQGYQLLLDPDRRPHTFERVFKLSLMSRDRAKLTTAMKALLDRGPHENLHTNVPLIHVGGAGTHYPRRDPFGNMQPKKESWNLGVVGPQTLALLENAARDNLTTDMTVDIAGFEGEWFDPYDVEGYLHEKGIFIDPSSSFAEAEVFVWPTAGSTTSTTFSSATSPKTPDARSARDSGPPRPFDQDQLEFLSRYDALPDEVNEFTTMNLTDIGFSDASTGSWMNFLQPGQGTKNHSASVVDPSLTAMNTWEGSHSSEFLQDSSTSRMSMFNKPVNGQAQSQEKKVIIIDVSKFVKVLTVSGVCIGRGPGFKRRDVDRALALSSFDAF
ncbi:hypothetical protein M409DRAFT_19697 [Zasmidium cellare ATCC 36951]|uniref:BZIP domain-containing protein n=1 Tax=Zasmidium cellare ATCC 36951 TaxID=1080233 RepID=A0A6A6CV61_ZASCE|nr:uncharacterized protein M409DRAFT_19697 [Zasmidium cellare ATCC 36951]KAF2170090.1 hypothetical protein M409DRAFT_19697 [Zasmidium cellare ATCC 36951]